jgi:subtilisin family serine protease
MSQADHDHDHDPLPAGVARADHEFGGGYLYRPGRLLAAGDDRDLVQDQLSRRRIGLRHEPVGDTGFEQYFLDFHGQRTVPVPELISSMRGLEIPLGERRPQIYPVGVMYGASHPKPYPAAPPRPGGPLAYLPLAGDEPGAGVRVAVLDSGVVEYHDWLGDRVERRPADVEAPELDQQGRLSFYSGHGTFIAGVVLQHAPGATVVARRIFGGDGVIDDLGLAEALWQLPEVEVLNLSLGGYTHDDVGLPLTAAALGDCFERNPGLVVVASAGNHGDSRPVYPAADKRVIAVAAVDDDAARPCFSDFGDWVDASAPGVDVQSTFFDVQAEPEPAQPPNCLQSSPVGMVQFEGWALWSGTSFAAPRVAGAIAAMIRPGTDGREAAFRMLGATGVPRQRSLGVHVNPVRYG